MSLEFSKKKIIDALGKKRLRRNPNYNPISSAAVRGEIIEELADECIKRCALQRCIKGKKKNLKGGREPRGIREGAAAFFFYFFSRANEFLKEPRCVSVLGFMAHAYVLVILATLIHNVIKWCGLSYKNINRVIM